MKTLLRKRHPLLKIANGALVDLPTPSAISAWWNFGSLLGLCLISQIATGLFLAIHYIPHTDYAFTSVVHICKDVNYGWLLRTMHANGASFFFICLFFHIGRGLYYGSYNLVHTWIVGVAIFFLTIITAFIGYVLPWGQMSFWGATVITNLLSAIPYLGVDLVQWVWGGFSVRNATLTRFFTFHFLFPFVVAALTIVHLLFLHETGSRNPIGAPIHADKSPFHPYYSYKDVFGMLLLILCLLGISLLAPYSLGDPDNFIIANPLVTPPHIQPEWYFLFAYAILRSIPNKLGGVIALVLSIAILFIIPFLGIRVRKGAVFNPPIKVVFWALVVSTALLRWIGARPVEDPYILVGQVLTVVYFGLYLALPAVDKAWGALLAKSSRAGPSLGSKTSIFINYYLKI